MDSFFTSCCVTLLQSPWQSSFFHTGPLTVPIFPSGRIHHNPMKERFFHANNCWETSIEFDDGELKIIYYFHTKLLCGNAFSWLPSPAVIPFSFCLNNLTPSAIIPIHLHSPSLQPVTSLPCSYILTTLSYLPFVSVTANQNCSLHDLPTSTLQPQRFVDFQLEGLTITLSTENN